MPIYGYQRDVVDPEFGLLELREVSFDLSPDGLRRVADFLRYHADRMEAGDWRSSHGHIDTYDDRWRHDHPGLDLVVIHHRAFDSERRAGTDGGGLQDSM